MIVLDTNVVSEAFRPNASKTVERWFGGQAAKDLYVCAPVMAELRFGIVRLDHGARRDALATRYNMIKEEFRSKILSFDLRAAEMFADIFFSRTKAGRPILPFDAQIAAIARARAASVATRNVKDFEGCGVKIIDPWSQGG